MKLFLLPCQRWAIAGLALAALAASPRLVAAAEVRVGISSRDTYVGMPVTFQVRIDNATEFDPPTMPEIADLRIEPIGDPAHSSQTTVINGKVSTRSSVTYSFAVTPLRPGNFHMPPIAVRADGKTLETRAFDFVASKSETGDLLFVQIAGKEKDIYVGQSLDLVLKIWVRPYTDKQLGITLGEGDMWQLLAAKSNWGPFQQRIEELAAKGQRPIGTEVLRKDQRGASHSYYLYEIPATIYPKKPGKIDASDVQVVVLYPTALGQSHDPFESMLDDMGMGGGSMFGGAMSPFGRQLVVEKARPVVAEAKVEPIEVREIPVAARPADYRGAVGKYLIKVQATPTAVKAGDPITLHVGIAGTGPMDLVQAPPLADLPALTKNFKVPNEPLAGYVEGARKVFSTTIRPRTDRVTEIPAIPFTYFDPQVGKFVTAKSDPIKIEVAPADTLALDAVVGRSKVSASDSVTATASAPGPLLTNYSSSSVLVNEAPATALSPRMWFIVLLPPAVVLAMLAARSRAGVALLAGSFRSATRKCEAAIEAAQEPAAIGLALRTYLAKRLNFPVTADANTLVGALRAGGSRTLAVRVERLLQQCDEFGRAGFGSLPPLAELKHQATAILHDLQLESRRVRPAAPRASRGLRPTSAFVAAAALSLAGSAAQAAELTSPQRDAILAEATARYHAALDNAGSDSAEAKDAFADAAQKYQLLVDDGIHNSQLFFNLGNAYLESGATGRAIANYRRALALAPTDQAARTNLELAQTTLHTQATDHTTATSLAARLAAANDWLNRFVSPRVVFGIALAAWFALWIVLGLRLAEFHFPWKTAAAAAFVVTAVAATSHVLSVRAASEPAAIVVASGTPLRTGDGENFPAVGSVSLAEGQSVGYLRTRGDWTQVRTATGQSGWLPNSAVELL